MSSSLPLPLPPNLPLHRKPYSLPHSTLFLFPIPKLSPHSLFKSHICHSTSPSNSDREEVRWLREEQRWLREEQRWLREEQRWDRERDALLHEISDLKLRIQALEHQNSIQGASVSETIANIAGLLQVLKERGLIAESGSSATPMVLLEKEKEKEEEVVVVEEKVVRVSEEGEKKRRKTLRKGSEGDEVQAMQEALQKLGFYSGEEDMEYSSFSSGTESAVKTWQATQGAPEDGIMTGELLERLYMGHQIVGTGSNVDADQKESTVTVSPKEGANGAVVASITEISEVQQKVVKEGVTKVEVSEHRVFLLGENRWEEPSRLGKIKTKDATTKCLTCRGEGRLMCTECDGTGEPNIEEQFLEWVDEGANCPYCEGLGYTICDGC
ncbi:protein disulfide isomerase pTAC5, chloroplastic isoform X2 [Corylus avellana]|uniref:protein disulfide isomerase pTAC5, chloroplastic isoform X2 n=1 Tax=Corylus avellana TaxID=13451 RepID=UPI00286A5E64|nr:protein disulfide isomerase pTAC5, chloroplastic isoform X2 [Corylus avellana]